MTERERTIAMFNAIRECCGWPEPNELDVHALNATQPEGHTVVLGRWPNFMFHITSNRDWQLGRLKPFAVAAPFHQSEPADMPELADDIADMARRMRIGPLFHDV